MIATDLKPPRPTATRGWCHAALTVTAALSAWPLTASAQAFTFAPFAGIVETYSDNVALSPDDIARSGWITEIIPGFRAELKGARARGRMEFRLYDAHYASESQLDDTRRFLDATGTVEPIENWFFIDARADITQQNRSAFGTSSTPDRPSVSGNQVETSVLKVSPHVRGDWGDIATYRLRYNYADVRTDDATLADTRITELVGRLANAGPGGRMGWAVDGQVLEAKNDVIGTVDNRRIRGVLSFAVTPLVRLSVLEGYETQTFESPERRSNDTPGAGITWTPNDRTRLAGIYEKRFFGDGYSASLGYRTGRIAIRGATVRDATVLPGAGLGGGSPVQALLADLVAASVVDPEERAAAARQRLEEFGIASYSSLSSGVLTSRPVVYKSSDAALAFTWPRDIVTLTYSRRDQRSLGLGTQPPAPEDDYSQRGIDANWAHRLTPVTTLNVFATRLHTVGESATGAETRQNRYGLAVVSRLGPHTTAAIGVRRVSLDTTAPIGDYRENAAYAAFAVRY